MTNIQNIHSNMISNPHGCDSSLYAIFENLYILNADNLEVNRPNPNLIVLSNSFRFVEGYVKK